MKHWSDFLEESGEYSQIRRAINQNRLKKKGAVSISGCSDAAKAHMVHSFGKGYDFRLLITSDEQKARQYCEDLKNFEEDVFYYPARDLLFFNADLQGNEIISSRMTVISRILENGKGTIVTTIDGCMDSLMPISEIQKNSFDIIMSDSVDLPKVKRKLVRLGYDKTANVTMPGQFSQRGDILDIFPLTSDMPVRIELFGDDVDRICYFDPETQRSTDELLDGIKIYPASEVVLDEGSVYAGLRKIREECDLCVERLRGQGKLEESHRLKVMVGNLEDDMKSGMNIAALSGFMKYFFDDTVTFLEYFPEKTLVFLDDPARLDEKLTFMSREFSDSMQIRLEKGYIMPGQISSILSKEDIAYKLKTLPLAAISGLEQKDSLIETTEHFELISRNSSHYHSRTDELMIDLERWVKNSYRVVLMTASRTHARRMHEQLNFDYHLPADMGDAENAYPKPGRILIVAGNLVQGFEYPNLRTIIITENDMFGARKKKKRKKSSSSPAGEAISSFNELKIGDYVVHENHGIGIYRGIEKRENRGVTKDYLKIEYSDGGSLFVPVTQFDIIQKYAASDAQKTPKLNSLSGKEWHKTHAKVKGAVTLVAKELVSLYAARENKKGYAYGPDTVWQTEFEEMFPFTETDDQLEAIRAVKADMESDKIMDRLICGDVGFGKTEVAIRAAFKAVQEGKQVVYLCPTTILAQQHYNNFVQRMANYPVRIDLLCRFRTPAQIKQTLADSKKGLVDIVIGTHRVLSKDVQFKDLGLLIIDEEQRFGVKHKETIKQLKNTVDVMTLTATPIPRTLHMSLIGIRDLSMLEEAPLDRSPIQTYVMEHDEEMIREAINRELGRGGQVYYVYNKVEDIDLVAARLQELIPDANIEFAHGQMSERQLERIMTDFVNGEIDILVSTTIIETGLDISNVNTIIIQNSDRFGLSQLYQLRGRVGRANRTAYAFLTYTPGKLLKEVAEKRLEAIREFTDLGSGVRIAMRDLELRGAGTLLGNAQSGHLEAVGYDLYCKMLNTAIKNLREDKEESILDSFETQIFLPVDAYIPSDYIAAESQKLDMYKKIATIENNKDYSDITDEMIDRFGEKIPDCVNTLLLVALIKAHAHRLYVTEIRGSLEAGTISLKLLPDAALDGKKFLSCLAYYKSKVTFNAKDKIITYKSSKNEKLDGLGMLIILGELTERMIREVLEEKI